MRKLHSRFFYSAPLTPRPPVLSLSFGLETPEAPARFLFFIRALFRLALGVSESIRGDTAKRGRGRKALAIKKEITARGRGQAYAGTKCTFDRVKRCTFVYRNSTLGTVGTSLALLEEVQCTEAFTYKGFNWSGWRDLKQ